LAFQRPVLGLNIAKRNIHVPTPFRG
jgi:hypothetical protein